MLITTDIRLSSSGLRSSDFSCPCCGYLSLPLETAVAVIELNARLYPAAPVHIESGCRCERHNAAVGGSKNSLHLDGLAVDLTHPALSPAILASFIVGTYGRVLYNPSNGCVHYELRGYGMLLVRLKDGKYYRVTSRSVAEQLVLATEKKNQ